MTVVAACHFTASRAAFTAGRLRLSDGHAGRTTLAPNWRLPGGCTSARRCALYCNKPLRPAPPLFRQKGRRNRVLSVTSAPPTHGRRAAQAPSGAAPAAHCVRASAGTSHVTRPQKSPPAPLLAARSRCFTHVRRRRAAAARGAPARAQPARTLLTAAIDPCRRWGVSRRACAAATAMARASRSATCLHPKARPPRAGAATGALMRTSTAAEPKMFARARCCRI